MSGLPPVTTVDDRLVPQHDIGPEPLQDPTPQEPAPQEPAPRLSTRPAAPTFAEAYPPARRRLNERQEAEVLANFLAVGQRSPDELALANRVALDLGINPAAMDDAETKKVALEAYQRREIQRRDFFAKNPILAQQLREVKFVAIAHDDLDNLATTETQFSALGAAFRRGRIQNDIGFLGARVAAQRQASGGTPSRDLTDLPVADQLRYRIMKERLDTLPESKGFFEEATKVVGQITETVPLTIGAGAAAASPALLGGPISYGAAATITTMTATFGITAAIEGGSFYLDMRDKGFTHEEAFMPAVAVAAVNGALETAGEVMQALPFMRVLRRELMSTAGREMIKKSVAAAGKTLLKEYPVVVGSEMLPEVWQEGMQIAMEKLTHNRAPAEVQQMIQEQTPREIVDRLLEIAGKTFQAMALLGLPGPGLNYISTVRRIRASNEYAQGLASAAESAQKSKARPRDQEAYRGSAHEMATEHGVANLYVDPGVLSKALSQADRGSVEAFGKAMPGVVAQIDNAVRDGELVAIPTADYLTHIAGTPMQARLDPHLKHDEDAFSPTEAKEKQKEIEAFIKQSQQDTEQALERASTGEERAKAKQIIEEGREIEEQFYEQLKTSLETDASIEVTTTEARQQAKILRALYVSLAQAQGLTPKEMLALRPLPKIEVAADFTPAGEVASEGLMQTVSIRAGRETLARFGLPPREKPYLVREVAAALEARQREKYGTIAADDRSPEAASRIAKWMVAEVEFELDNPGASAIGWYGPKFQAAIDTMGERYPELKTDKSARDLFTVLIAITSDGQAPADNLQHASDIYSRFRKGGETEGKLTSGRGTARQVSIEANLQRLQELLDRMGPEQMHRYLLREGTVKELRKIARDGGRELRVAYEGHIKLPMAALELGAKLGAFYANLMGAHGYLTMDRWWSRTFNRYRGTLLTAASESGKARVKALLGTPNLSDDELLVAVTQLRRSYEAKGFKDGTELEKAANTIYKDTFGTQDIPFNAGDRSFMLQAAQRAQKNLKLRGVNMSIADIQATLWYYEKRLYGTLGAKESSTESFDEAARRLVAAGDAAQKRVGVRGQPGAREADTRTTASTVSPEPGDAVFEPQGALSEPGLEQAGADAAGRGRVRAVAGTGGTTYGTPREGSVSAVGIHFSYAERTNLDSSRYGTGLRGAEFSRVDGDPRLSQRVYFYLDTTGEGVEPEPGVGDVPHEVYVHNLYDTREDPLEIRAKWFAGPQDPNILENAILDAGFGGYTVPGMWADQGMAVLIGKHDIPVQLIPRNQPLAQGALGRYVHALSTIFLQPGANASTVLHEMMHYYVSSLLDLGNNPDAPSGVRSQIETVLKFVGVKDLDAWNALSFEEQIPHHEALAYAWETYLAEGKAPTQELQSLFDRILSWMRRAARTVLDIAATYKREFDRDLPSLTPELRHFFGALLASEEQIARYDAVRDQAPLFLDKSQALKLGITEQQWQDYQDLLLRQRDAAVGKLTVDNLQNVKWLQSAVLKSQTKLQAQLEAARAKIREQVDKDVRGQPVYHAIETLRAGLEVSDGETTQHLKLDRDSVSSGRRWLAGGEAKLDGLTQKGGLSPDAAALALGWPSGDDLIRAIFDAPPIEQAIDEETVRRLQEQEPLADPDTMRDRIAQAVHSELRDRVLAAEMKMLAGEGKPVRLTRAAAKEAAQRILDRTPVAEIRPARFSTAEGRAAVRAREAIQKGDVGAALFAIRQQLLQNQLTRLSIAARDEVASSTRAFRAVWRSDEKVAKHRSMPHVQAARAILGAYGLGDPSGAQQFFATAQQLEPNDSLINEMRRRVADSTAAVPPANTQRGQRRASWQQLPLAEFRQMRDTVKVLWHQSERAASIGAEGKRVLLDDAAAESIQSMSSHYGQPKYQGPVSEKTRSGLLWRRAFAGLRRVEHWAHQFGGAKSPLIRYFFRPLHEAFDDYMAARSHGLKDLHKMLVKLDLPQQVIEAPELREGARFESTAQLLGALQHAGNDSNLRRLLVPYEWATEENGELDTTGWDAFLARAMKDGLITKAHMDYVQAVWDFNAKVLAPQSQKTMRKLFGVYWTPVETQPLKTPWGTYEGGYMPATPDPSHPGNSDLQVRDGLDALQDMESRFLASTPGSNPAGHTISRLDLARRPLSLDLRLQLQHLDEALRFVHLQPAVRDAASLLRNREFAGYLNNVDQTAIKSMLMPMLESTSRNQMTKPSEWRLLDKFFSGLRRTTGLGFMFLSLRNALQQFGGFGNANQYVKARHLRAAFTQFYAHPLRTRAEVVQLSKAMAVRLDDKMGQMQDDIEQVLSPTPLGKLKAWTNEHGYVLQRLMQGQVDVVTWVGAFQQSIEESGKTRSDEGAVEDAVAVADSAVRLSQGSQTPADVANYERAGAFVRLFTQFSGYFNTVLNTIVTAQGASEKTAATVRALIFPTLVAATVTALLSDGSDWDDKDDNGVLDEFLAWFFVKQPASAALSMVPAFGPAISAEFITSRRAPGDRVTPAPFWSLVNAAGRLGGIFDQLDRTAQTGITGTQIRDALQVFSMSTGIPLSPLARPLGYAVDQTRATGAKKATSTADYVRGLVSGR